MWQDPAIWRERHARFQSFLPLREFRRIRAALPVRLLGGGQQRRDFSISQSFRRTASWFWAQDDGQVGPAADGEKKAELLAMGAAATSPQTRIAYGVFLLCALQRRGGAGGEAGLHVQGMGTSHTSSAWFTRWAHESGYNGMSYLLSVVDLSRVDEFTRLIA